MIEIPLFVVILIAVLLFFIPLQYGIILSDLANEYRCIITSKKKFFIWLIPMLPLILGIDGAIKNIISNFRNLNDE